LSQEKKKETKLQNKETHLFISLINKETRHLDSGWRRIKEIHQLDLPEDEQGNPSARHAQGQ
jgi:hypothetical protein